MNNREKLIAKLSKDRVLAKARIAQLSMCNVANLTLDEKIDSDIRYNLEKYKLTQIELDIGKAMSREKVSNYKKAYKRQLRIAKSQKISLDDNAAHVLALKRTIDTYEDAVISLRDSIRDLETLVKTYGKRKVPL